MRVCIVMALLIGCSSGSGKGGKGKGDDSTLTTAVTGIATGTGTGAQTGPTTGTPSGTTTPWMPETVIEFTGDVPKNLIMISIDTTRKDHLGAYGNLGLTPFIDTFSSTGVVMQNHMQCSHWTMASGTCTMHGRFPADIGHMPRLSAPSTPVPPGSPTLATAMRDNGYYTAMSTGNGYMGEVWGSATGYDDFAQQGPHGQVVAQAGLDLLDAAIADGRTTDGWFLHLHFMEPHEPYAPEPQYIVGLDLLDPWPNDLTVPGALLYERGQWAGYTPDQQLLLQAHLAVYYQAEVRMVDARIEWAFNELTARGLVDDALVVFWNDHGEQFWEHGYQSHAYTLMKEENDGVLFFWADNIVPREYTGPTSAIDMVPTILDLYGFATPPEMVGVPIGAALPGRIRQADGVARDGAVQSAEQNGHMLHYRWNGTYKLYDRNVDPDQTTDLYSPTDPTALMLWCDAMEPMMRRMEPLVGNITPVVDPLLVCPAPTTP